MMMSCFVLTLDLYRFMSRAFRVSLKIYIGGFIMFRTHYDAGSFMFIDEFQ
jgi:hypothetical protein